MVDATSPQNYRISKDDLQVIFIKDGGFKKQIKLEDEDCIKAINGWKKIQDFQRLNCEDWKPVWKLMVHEFVTAVNSSVEFTALKSLNKVELLKCVEHVSKFIFNKHRSKTLYTTSY